MKVIVCLDDDLGMMFNRRRQSRDRALLLDAQQMIGSSALWMCPYSEALWKSMDVSCNVSETFLEDAKKGEWCFVENRFLAPYADKLEEMVIYRWNRRYPSDQKLDLSPTDCGLRPVSSYEFVGSSHEKITKEVYRK